MRLRKMTWLSSGFVDCISGRTIHYWRDHHGRTWMAERARSWFRVAVPSGGAASSTHDGSDDDN